MLGQRSFHYPSSSNTSGLMQLRYEFYSAKNINKYTNGVISLNFTMWNSKMLQCEVRVKIKISIRVVRVNGELLHSLEPADFPASRSNEATLSSLIQVNNTMVYHRLRSSGSTVVTMTSKVNGKMEILTPCKSETP